MTLSASFEAILTPAYKTGFTVKVFDDVAEPPGVVTITVPVVPDPTVTVIEFGVFAVMAAAVPPIVTDVALDKLVPLITKEDPTQPLEVVKLEIAGGI